MKETLSIYEKLSCIQQEFKAKKSRFNAFGKYNFRSAEDILEALKPFNIKYNVLFTVNETLVNWDMGVVPCMQSTATIIDAATGMTLEATAIVGVDLNQKGMQVPQQFGSASSYAKKYSLGNLLLIDDTADSDATNKTDTFKAKPKLEGDALDKARLFLSQGKGTVEDIKKKYEIDPSILKTL